MTSTVLLKPLSDLVDVFGGGTPSKKEQSYWKGSIPWVSPKDMKRWEIHDTIDHVSRSAVTETACKLVEPPAVLMVVRGMILIHSVPVAISRVPLAINQDLKALVPREGVDPDYLAFMVAGAAPELLARVDIAGHGTRRLPTEAWTSLKIRVPAMAEQRRIVARVRDCLERIDEIGGLRDAMVAEGAAVVSSFVTERARLLRTQYAVRTIEQIVAGRSGAMASGPFGSQLKHSEFVADGHLVISIPNVQRHRFDPVRRWMVSDETLTRLGRFRVEPHDLLITVMGTVGRCCAVPEDIGTAVTSKHVYRIRLPRDVVSPLYASLLVNFDREISSRLQGRATGGVMPGLNSTKLKELRIPLPPIPVQEALVEVVDQITGIEEIARHAGAKPELQLRTALLRNAFAGEL
jgi:type I restriction enzyme, S subunit